MELKEPLYVDTSALVKLVVDEAESAALAHFITESECQLTSSEISEIELVRAIHRVDLSKAPEAERLLRKVILLPVTASIRARASQLRPSQMKLLDAVHLATAIEIQASSNSFLSYDKTLNMAARGAGLEPVSPA